jgi:hypothetical protein
MKSVEKLMYSLEDKITELKSILLKVWSIESSSKWTPQNPANGQCGVTTLVINDLFKGDIMKTPAPDGWHFYNKINGQRYDFTESQFSLAIDYMDVSSNREEAFLDTNEKQYNYLKQSVLKHFTKND